MGTRVFGTAGGFLRSSCRIHVESFVKNIDNCLSYGAKASFVHPETKKSPSNPVTLTFDLRSKNE
jgi:hypothetical protein